MSEAFEKTENIQQIEPPIIKKVKTSRGRPKIRVHTIIPREIKRYFEKQSELVRTKFEFIDRNATTISAQEALNIIQEKFGGRFPEIFKKVHAHKRGFLDQYNDPADEDFLDQCDYNFLLKKFGEGKNQKEVGHQTMLMVYAEHFSEDMDIKGFQQVCDTLQMINKHIESNNIPDQEISLIELRTDQANQNQQLLINVIKQMLSANNDMGEVVIVKKR